MRVGDMEPTDLAVRSTRCKPRTMRSKTTSPTPAAVPEPSGVLEDAAQQLCDDDYDMLDDNYFCIDHVDGMLVSPSD